MLDNHPEHEPATQHRYPTRVHGAPNGFEDVVGNIIPIADDEPDTPPHWSVTFATADADTTTAKATELGGRGDRLAVRRALVHRHAHNSHHRHRRPAGLGFTASKFVPKNKDLVS